MLLQTNSTARRQLASRDITFFARYYLNNHVRSSLSDLHKEWVQIVTQESRVALAAPRGHAKSTWITLVYPLWCILFHKKKFIVVISDSSQQASDLLGSIIEELETNDRILRDFGKIAGYIPPTAEEKKKWSSKEIVTTTDVKVVAKSWGSRVRGIRYKENRPDLIILDDVENDENVQNEEQRLKVKNVFKKSILNLGSHETQIIVVGTILHFDSLLMDLLNNPPKGWFTKLYKAYIDNKPLWPEWWTPEKLEQKKAEIGSIAFEQEFMNNPLDPSQQIIKPAAFYSDTLNLPEYEFYGYIDLAISEKETADYTAIVTIAKHKQTGKLYVIDPVRMRGDVMRILELVFTQHSKYHYKLFGVESVAFQKAFSQILNAESARRNIYIPTSEVEIDKDKVRRAIEVTPHIENGTVLFNNSYVDFMSELIQFPKASHDDFVDALVGCINLAITRGSGTIAVGSNLRPNSY